MRTTEQLRIKTACENAPHGRNGYSDFLSLYMATSCMKDVAHGALTVYNVTLASLFEQRPERIGSV